jgi:Uma2 family endonuclease
MLMEKVLIPVQTEQRLRMSYEEFLEWADEDTHAEWVDGEVIVFMPAKTVHADLAIFLAALLRFFTQFFGLGKVLAAPYEMKVEPSGRPSREPDILFVATHNLGRITEDKLAGAADLIVEIVSDDSVTRDRTTKRREYEAAGVSEYWVLDPRPGQKRAQFWVLGEGGRYQRVAVGKDGIYRSTVIPGFWLRVDWLWAKELPDPQLTFAEIAGFPSDVTETLRQIAARGPQLPEE